MAIAWQGCIFSENITTAAGEQCHSLGEGEASVLRPRCFLQGVTTTYQSQHL